MWLAWVVTAGLLGGTEVGPEERPLAPEPDAPVPQLSPPPDAVAWPKDPNRTRGFLMPTAMMLERNELYLSQKQLVVTDLDWGVTSFLTLEFATALPALAAGLVGINFGFGVKAGASITPWLHLATAVDALVTPGNVTRPLGVGVWGLYFGVITIGDESLDVSLLGGRLFLAPAVSPLDSGVFGVAAQWRLGTWLRLMTEHFLVVPGPGSFLLADLVGVRLGGDQLSFDLGVFTLTDKDHFNLGLPFPLPWLDVTWNFR